MATTESAVAAAAAAGSNVPTGPSWIEIGAWLGEIATGLGTLALVVIAIVAVAWAKRHAAAAVQANEIAALIAEAESGPDGSRASGGPSKTKH